MSGLSGTALMQEMKELLSTWAAQRADELNAGWENGSVNKDVIADLANQALARPGQ